MTASPSQKERLVDQLPEQTVGRLLRSPQGTSLSEIFKGLSAASENPAEQPPVETPMPEAFTDLPVAPEESPVEIPDPEVDVALQETEEIINLAEQQVSAEAPVEVFLQQSAETDVISPDVNEEVEAYLAKSEADGASPEQEVHELAKQAEKNDSTQEVKVVLVPQKRSEYEAAKKMNIHQGGWWLHWLVDKLKEVLRLRGKVAAFRAEDTSNPA